MTPISSRLFRVARLRPLTLAAVTTSADQVPRGQRAPLDEFRTLLINRSAGLVESSRPVRGGTWRRTREHQSSAHSSDSSRLSALTRLVDSSRSLCRGCYAVVASSSSVCTADSSRTSRRGLLP